MANVSEVSTCVTTMMTVATIVMKTVANATPVESVQRHNDVLGKNASTSLYNQVSL